MNKKTTNKILISLVFVINALAGCAGINSFPSAARPGDTITLALGSQDGMNKSNTTVSFTDDATETQVDITASMRAIMRLYADPTSGIYGGSTGFLGKILTEEIHHDPWLTAMVIDLPTSLPIGSGKINISTTAPQPGAPEPDINSHSIVIEILPGTGTSNTFDFFANGSLVPGTLVPLEPRNQFVFRPPNTSFYTTGSYGAITFTFQLPITISGADTDIINIVAQDLQQVTESKRQLIWKAQGNQLLVSFISPEGALDVLETRFSLLSDNEVTFPISTNSTPPTLLSATYFDIDGNITSGPPIGNYTITTELP